MKNSISQFLIILAILLIAIPVAHAGTLTPPGAPADTMYTLTDIYNLASGTTGTIGSGSLPATPGSVSPTFQSLTSVYTALSTQVANLLNGAAIAIGTNAFGFTGSYAGDTDATKILTTALHPGTYNATNLTPSNVKTGVSYGAGQMGTLVNGLTATNQTICYSSGTPISCAGTGQDGDTLRGITHSYTDNGDGTVTDNATGLTWQQCPPGFTGNPCTGSSITTFTWANALAYCNNNTAGLPGSGWYLPNISQLNSLMDFGASSDPYINHTYFPGPQDGGYLSSTTAPGIPADAMIIVANTGRIVGVVKTVGGSDTARCVRE